MFKKLMFSIVFFLILFEIGSRIMMQVFFHNPFFKPANAIYEYYPLLEHIKDYKYDKNRKNLLILGGSVVFNDTIHIGKEAKAFLNMPTVNGAYTAHMCALDKLIPNQEFNVLSLAESAHNTLDSYYKYLYCKRHHVKFDYIYVYHALNDNRCNNIWRAEFNDDYRHIEFYDDLYTIMHHPHINISTIPFMIDWLILNYKKDQQGERRYISKDVFMGLLTGNPEANVQEGKDLKTIKTFRRNVEGIVKLAIKHKEKVVLTVYAWNLPLDYDFKRFYAKELPYYEEQLFPTELYGMPDNVRAGLIAHNNIIRELHQQYPEMPFIDMDAAIPDTKEYFNDLCHLTDQGCQLMAHELYKTLGGKQ